MTTAVEFSSASPGRSTATSARDPAGGARRRRSGCKRAAEKLWEPSAELVERSRMTEYMRWLAAERGLEFDDYHGALALVGRRARGLLGLDLGLLRGSCATAIRGRPRLAQMPGAEWFPGARLNYAEHVFRDRDDGEVAILARLRAARAGRAHLGRAPRPGRRRRRRPARAGRRPRRPRRRLPAQHPRGDRRLPRHRLDRRRLVVLLARLRRRQRHRPLRPDRAQGPLRRRRLPLRRQATSTAATSSPTLQAEMPTLRAHRRPPLPRPRPRPLAAARRDRLGRADRRRRGRRARLRAGPLRPPALGPLLLRHDRPAEGDRPGPGRHPARAPEEAPPPRRPPPRRPPLLVHHHRLDDVELPRLRPADRGRDRHSTTATPATPTWACSGTSPSAPASPASAPAPATSPPA